MNITELAHQAFSDAVKEGWLNPKTAIIQISDGTARIYQRASDDIAVITLYGRLGQTTKRILSESGGYFGVIKRPTGKYLTVNGEIAGPFNDEDIRRLLS